MNTIFLNAQEKDVKTLVFAIDTHFISLDPSRTTDTGSAYASNQVHDTLVRFKSGTSEIEAALA